MVIEFIITSFLFLVLLYYLGAPVLVKFSTWQSGHPRIKSLQREDLPPNLISYFDNQRYWLESLGFTFVACICMEEQTPNVTPYLMMFRNEKTLDLAIAASLLSHIGNKERFVQYVEFCRKFTDGTELNTNNLREQNAFRRDPNKMIFSFPSMDSVPGLYTMHIKLVEKEKRGLRPFLPAEGDEIRSFHNEFVTTLTRQSQFGYLQFDPGTGRYRPTWKGAYLMTWKLVWPVGTIRKALGRIEAAARIRAMQA